MNVRNRKNYIQNHLAGDGYRNSRVKWENYVPCKPRRCAQTLFSLNNGNILSAN